MRLHPLKELRKDRKTTYKKIALAIREANDGQGPSAGLLAQYAGGFKTPGRAYARMIHNAYPSISTDALLYFQNDNAA